jgi:hypothetical protein
MEGKERKAKGRGGFECELLLPRTCHEPVVWFCMMQGLID